MQIVYKRVGDLIPYDNNPRQNRAAVLQVAESIEQFGFKVPIVIDKNNVIVAGHTRHWAAESLNMETVPCIVADDLTPQQVKAFRLADNKVGELATWDITMLDAELKELELDFDMGDFGFELDFEDDDEDDDDDNPWAEATQDKVANILNLGIAEFRGVGEYDIPQILPVYDVPEVDEWVGFNYALSEKAPENKGLHFFVDDYQFERIWNNPKKYIEIISRFKCVLAPDFSPFGDMPFALQIFNHYRKHWCARLWQDNDITVYPTIRASTDPRSPQYYLLGEPERSVVAFSSMWATRSYDITKNEFELMVETLQPAHILLYGNEFDFISDSGIPFTRIPTFAESRFKNG